MSQFEDAYYALLMRSWTSEDYVMELMSDPAPALREVGLDVPDGVTVAVRRKTEGEGSIEEQYKLWTDGIAAGSITLVVPEAPPVNIGEVSDAELSAMAGGTDYCCCPCCTCTA
ncbi:hypothetical protein [Rudaeicoccus suwonensis]|uniref:hypothetical protein n=1 Tax=Rudaeicoccus suwonensis TaxID=657409 RepID=UPI0011A217F7|nr:hypothetical protein [Rudaeicoccus suwonensis]